MTDKNLMEDIRRISGVNPRKCMKCGKCSGTCPAYDEMDLHRISLWIWLKAAASRSLWAQKAFTAA